MSKENLRSAFLAGFIASRKAGFTGNSLHPVTERTANRQFDTWYEMNSDE